MVKKTENLYGLVLTGGKSSRMNQDKSSMEFHGKKQVVHVYELLSQFCDKVFISCREDQSVDEGKKGLPQIYDAPVFTNIGPLGGILSAFERFPNISWLVLGCDLPLVNEKTLSYLLEHRDLKKDATAYQSVHDQLPEPLCAVYEVHAHQKLLKHFKDGKTCPRKFLINANTHLLQQQDKMSLENINTPEELKNILTYINKHA